MTARRTLASLDALEAAGLADPDRRAGLDAVARRYAIAITPESAALIDPNDPDDPIARQFAPSPAELVRRPAEADDPIGDLARSPVPGIVHRYPDRVLLLLTHACATYCRFCFRRERVGRPGSGLLSAEDEARALGYVRAHPEIWEVILSGGDPLVVPPKRLAAVMARLGAIDHVRVVRVHTRVPAVAPERVNTALLQALAAAGRPVYVALHLNHPRELTANARAAIARLADAGFPLLGQTVLLKGVNDDPETLAELMRALVEARVRPYYLHHPDLAPGTSHFRVPLARGREIVRSLRGRISGLCQPTYVLDLPGGRGKAPIGPSFAEGEHGRFRVQSPLGGCFDYVDDAADGGNGLAGDPIDR